MRRLARLLLSLALLVGGCAAQATLIAWGHLPHWLAYVGGVLMSLCSYLIAAGIVGTPRQDDADDEELYRCL